jgi:PLD-like domain
MRKRASGFVTVRAISGTHVVFLAFDMKESDAKGLMGFAIQRTDLTENETIWLRGNKTFASIRPSTGIEDASSHDHPFQAFQWADYTAKPGYKYKYKVIPMYGVPGHLTDGAATSVTIETEPLTGGKHDVHFNRGAIASQAFTKRFPGMTLDEAGAPAYAWLARDLLPGLLGFIAKAKDSTYSLHAAIYEMKWPAVLAAFKAAKNAGAEVKILYHGKDDDTGNANDAEIANAQIKSICFPRVNAKLMHNKFIVLSKNGKPVSVWTGSTNISRNALHGQLNVGHAIHDAALAKRFFEYWKELKDDPVSSDLKDWAETNNARNR